MEYLPIVFTVILIILTIVLIVVGFQLVLVLMQLKKTLQKVNTTLDTVEDRVGTITAPLSNLGGAAAGLQTGMRMFEMFVEWLHRDEDVEEETEEKNGS